jgi:hypothetical protein
LVSSAGAIAGGNSLRPERIANALNAIRSSWTVVFGQKTGSRSWCGSSQHCQGCQGVQD